MAFQVYCDVEPKRQALAQANLELSAAAEKLEAIRKKLAVSTGSNSEEVPKRWSPAPTLRIPPSDRAVSDTYCSGRNWIFHEYIHLSSSSVDIFCLLDAD